MTNELVMCPRGGRPCTLAHCPTSGCFLSPGSVRIGPNDVEVNVEKIYPAVWVPKHELEHAVKEKVAATQTAQALAAKVDRLQAVCAAAYQLAGAVGAPVRFLDALSDAASDELEARACTADLLPIGPLDCDAVRETRLEAARSTGWAAKRDHYAVPVLFNPYTGEPRDVRDVQSDPQGILIMPPSAQMLAAAPPPAAPEPSEAEVEAACAVYDALGPTTDRGLMADALRAAAAARGK